MIPSAFIEQAKAALAQFCTSSGQLRVFVPTANAPRPDDGAWQDSGAPFACSLYEPKGSEIPLPLSLIDRTVYKLAWTDGSISITHKNQVVIAGITYDVHDVPTDRSNQFLPIAMVSRLK